MNEESLFICPEARIKSSWACERILRPRLDPNCRPFPLNTIPLLAYINLGWHLSPKFVSTTAFNKMVCPPSKLGWFVIPFPSLSPPQTAHHVNSHKSSNVCEQHLRSSIRNYWTLWNNPSCGRIQSPSRTPKCKTVVHRVMLLYIQSDTSIGLTDLVVSLPALHCLG